MELQGPFSDKYTGSALTTFIRQPALPLREYIDFYYGEEAFLDNFPDPYMPHKVIIMPGGCVEMHLPYHDTSFRLQIGDKRGELRAFITGERNIQTLLHVDHFKRACKEIHVKFRPGGFFRLFGVQGKELRNSYFEIDEVLGHEGEDLVDRINNSTSMEERIEIAEFFFMKKMKVKQKERGINGTLTAVTLIVQTQGRLGVRQILREMSLSERTLERRFMDHTGLTLKEFSRVVRFKRVLNKILTANKVDWCDLAQSCGYYDQAHLIDDFRTATTFSPERFLQENGKTLVKFRTGLFLLKPSAFVPPSYNNLMEKTAKSEEKSKMLI